MIAANVRINIVVGIIVILAISWRLCLCEGYIVSCFMSLGLQLPVSVVVAAARAAIAASAAGESSEAAADAAAAAGSSSCCVVVDGGVVKSLLLSSSVLLLLQYNISIYTCGRRVFRFARESTYVYASDI